LRHDTVFSAALGADRVLAEWGERLAAMLSRPPRFAATIAWVAFGSDTVLWNHRKFPTSRSLHARVSAPTRARCDLAPGGQNARRDRNERYSDSRRGMQNRNQLDTLFFVTRIMTSSLTCRPILYWDEAGLVLFVIFVTRVAEIVTSWARSKII
jgi:hypothetical protein